MHICTKLGANFTIANPVDYDMPAKSIELAREFAAVSGSKINLLQDPHEAVKGAHVIYTDTWTSMGQEAETQKREAVFPPYQVNEKLVSEARSDVIVMHCLPAHRNHELTDAVADGPHSVIFPQAHNRLHAQKAVLVHLLGAE
jgi:ornithine carbamoyltransferase